MANETKKTNVAPKPGTKAFIEAENKDLIKKNKKLEKDQKKLEEMFEKLQGQFATLMETQNAKQDEVVVKESVDSKPKRLRRDDYVEIQSLVPYGVSLFSRKFGNIKFFEPFEITEVTVEHLKDVLRDSGAKSIIKSGMVYIRSQQFVKENNLSKDYEKFLTPEQLEDFFNTDTKTMGERYKKLPKGQRNSINQSVFMAIAHDDDDFDKNIIYVIDKAYEEVERIPSVHPERKLVAQAEKQKRALKIAQENNK